MAALAAAGAHAARSGGLLLRAGTASGIGPPAVRARSLPKRQSTGFFSAASYCGVALAAAATAACRRSGLRCRALQQRAASTGLGQPRRWHELFEDVYCINLDRRPERWEFMQQQFQRMGMQVRRFPAVDGSRLDIESLAKIGIVSDLARQRYLLPNSYKLFGFDLTAGAVGCALSHLFIWKDILGRVDARRELKPFLVVEDDCAFDPALSESILEQRLQHVPRDWQLVFLGGQDLQRCQHLLECGQGVRRHYAGFKETTAYMVTVEGARACLEVSIPLRWQIDTHLSENDTHALRRGGIDPKGWPVISKCDPRDMPYTVKPMSYCLWPPCVRQDRDTFNTDIQISEH